jgi:probable F420-dependent oxidoreductase
VLIDGNLGTREGLAAVARQVAEADAMGLDGVWSTEMDHDPFLPLALVAERSPTLSLGTGIAVAFARTPMTVAYQAMDLQTFSRGRMILGLGSQVKPHIERRFGMPWSQPAARMREFILALHAVWDAWQDGGKLDFRGDFYQHTLMTPMFSPTPSEFGAPAVMLAAVGTKMTEVAAEVADGLIVHGFTTERYLREVTLPALGSVPGGFVVSGSPFVVTGRTEEEYAAADRAVRAQIAFYGSTPAYRPVLELHGWGELGDALHKLSRASRWAEMGSLVDDDVLAAFAVTGSPVDVATGVRERFEGLLTRCTFSNPEGVISEDVLAGVAALVGKSAR